MHEETYSHEIAEEIARAALARQPAFASTNVAVKDVGSPWNERVQLRKKRGHDLVVFSLWNSTRFLTGRIHRLAFFVLDSRDPLFGYDRSAADGLGPSPLIKVNHNQIWSIYVDSRVERLGLENFFDRTLRRNIFIDSQKAHPWSFSSLLFQKLWERERFSHPEIIEYAHDIYRLVDDDGDRHKEAFEVEINRSMSGYSARMHVDSILSSKLREAADNLLTFVMTHCRGTLVEPSYYGIYFMYDHEIFAEMVTTKTDRLLLTLFDFETRQQTAYTVFEGAEDAELVQGAIKGLYDRISLHSRLKAMKNPYKVPIER